MIETELTLKVPIRIVPKDSGRRMLGFAGHSGMTDDETGKNIIEFWPGGDNLRCYLGEGTIENHDRVTIYANIGDTYMPCDIAQQILQLVKDKEAEINELINQTDGKEKIELIAKIREMQQ